jgi:large subunit ribosomal protein L25
MEKAELEVKLREGAKRSDRSTIRNSGLVPAIVYGKSMKNLMVSVDLKKFKKTIGGEAGRNVIISLKVSDGKAHKSVPVLTHELQRDVLTDEIIHVDFLGINMKEQLKTKVPIELTGEPIGVKEHGGILIHGFRDVEVKCLPADIPDKLEIDVSEMKINDSRHVSDLKIPQGVDVLTPMDVLLLLSSLPQRFLQRRALPARSFRLPRRAARSRPRRALHQVLLRALPLRRRKARKQLPQKRSKRRSKAISNPS